MVSGMMFHCFYQLQLNPKLSNLHHKTFSVRCFHWKSCQEICVITLLPLFFFKNRSIILLCCEQLNKNQVKAKAQVWVRVHEIICWDAKEGTKPSLTKISRQKLRKSSCEGIILIKWVEFNWENSLVLVTH